MAGVSAVGASQPLAQPLASYRRQTGKVAVNADLKLAKLRTTTITGDAVRYTVTDKAVQPKLATLGIPLDIFVNI